MKWQLLLVALIVAALFWIFTAGVNADPDPSPSRHMIVGINIAANYGDNPVHGYQPGPAVFTPETIAWCKQFNGPIRTASAVRCNGEIPGKWSERTPINGSQKTDNGVAWEAFIILSNATGRDLWINVPDQADDDYVKNLADLLKSGLSKNQKVYLEYSNELWNYQYPQSKKNLEEAEREVGSGNSDLDKDGMKDHKLWAGRRGVRRAVQVAKIFRDEFADQADRVRPVLCSHLHNPRLFADELAFCKKTYGDPAKIFYGAGGSVYYHLTKEDSDRSDMSAQEYHEKLNAAIDALAPAIRAETEKCKEYGLHHLCYEAGSHLKEDKSKAARDEFNTGPNSGELITKMLSTCQENGVEMLCFYNLNEKEFGLTEDVRHSSPKMEAILSFIKANQ